jgi:hypothetical protein
MGMQMGREDPIEYVCLLRLWHRIHTTIAIGITAGSPNEDIVA